MVIKPQWSSRRRRGSRSFQSDAPTNPSPLLSASASHHPSFPRGSTAFGLGLTSCKLSPNDRIRVVRNLFDGTRDRALYRDLPVSLLHRTPPAFHRRTVEEPVSASGMGKENKMFECVLKT
ncbi:hypothetical protein ZHAS_00016992 [Anopheles sinensis]|uniref:Uncharacterized protein n=1 Tax=Anopheles sinensis TaxID=74873 RepID=A0A084WFJ3_ANOSI|nr:hypothetical protein ZHAS_00016992 [Anopheles sinensis]